MDEAIKVYPTVEELSSISSKVTCSQAGCKAVFKSSSNLNMHLLKHHKIAADVLSKKSRTCEYYCPIKMCIYHRNSKKCFDKLKYLKQHFLKVHAAKKYECNTCGKRFSTESFRNLHVKSCGKFLSCTCGATYSSSEAMLTHCKRKGAGHSLIKKDDSMPKRPVNLEENVNNCGTCESKSNRLIYPKLDKNFPIHYIAAIALSELSIPCNLSRAKSVAVQTDIQGEGTMVTFKLENKKRKSSRQTQTTAGKNKNLKISAETQTIGDYMKNKQRHYPKLTSKKRKKSMETQTREHAKLIVPSLKMGKGKVNMDVHIEGIPETNLTKDGKWFWDEKPKNSTSPTVSSISVVPRADKTSGKSELLQGLNFSKKELFSDLNRFNESFKSKSSVFYPNNTGGATDQQMFDINRLCNIETQTEMDSFLTECGEDTSFTLCSTTETQTTDDFDSLLYSNMCTQTSEDVDQLFDFNFVDIETQTAWPDLSD